MAGFLGPSQQLDFVLRVAEEVSNIPEICFLLLGEGTEKKKLLDMKRQRKLDNVRFASLVSREEYPSVVKDMDVGMACLSSRNTTPVYPGKIVGFMASSKPVLAFLHKESDGHAIIREAGCGHSSISGDHRTAARLVIELYEQKQRASEYGRRGFEFASRHFSRDRCIDALEKVLYGTTEGDVLAASAQT